VVKRALTCILLPLLGIPSCAPVGPNYSTPDNPVPDFWNTGLQANMDTSTPDIEAWWRKFNDPTLNKLISLAESQNRDLAIAAERVEEARAQRGISRGALFPTLGAGGGGSRNRSSESLPFMPPNPINIYDTGLSSGWETDFVGGLRRSVEASSASLEATQEVYHDTMVIIYADVASNYISYRTLQRRISLAQSNIAAQKKSVQITKDRKTAGLAPQIDVSQAETNLATSQALIPQLQGGLSATLNNLAVLVGRYPGSIGGMLRGSTKIPTPRESLSIGLPANLLRSRPDIRAAERTLAAQTASIGVAQAELYPKFGLSGTFSLQSTSSGNLVDTDSRAYSFGPSFQWRIFEGGRIRESIKVEESRTRQALANYEKTVLQAVAEVESSLASIKYEKRRNQFLDKSVTSAKETASLIVDNYTEGLVDFQNVLDAQRTVFDREDSAAASSGQFAINHVSLYRSLGGGTKMPKQPVLNDKP
jgi:NodT family efflux transporter outer membrane factor (OMF) lipoprotein